VLDVVIGGRCLRVADRDWVDPLDPTFAAQPLGSAGTRRALTVSTSTGITRLLGANVTRLFASLPYGPDDLDPATAPLLVEVTIPDGAAADAYTPVGLAVLGLPASFPLDSRGAPIPHVKCQPHGQYAFDAGLDGVDARSAAAGGDRELAWFPRGQTLVADPAVPFDDWWYA